jgi:hypothetical protein
MRKGTSSLGYSKYQQRLFDRKKHNIHITFNGLFAVNKKNDTRYAIF